MTRFNVRLATLRNRVGAGAVFGIEFSQNLSDPRLQVPHAASRVANSSKAWILPRRRWSLRQVFAATNRAISAMRRAADTVVTVPGCCKSQWLISAITNQGRVSFMVQFRRDSSGAVDIHVALVKDAGRNIFPVWTTSTSTRRTRLEPNWRSDRSK